MFSVSNVALKSYKDITDKSFVWSRAVSKFSMLEDKSIPVVGRRWYILSNKCETNIEAH